MEIQEANAEVVEALVARMLSGMQSLRSFTPSDGLSAALTFAFRYCKIIVSLSGDAESKRNNSMLAAATLRRMAAQIDMEMDSEVKATVH